MGIVKRVGLFLGAVFSVLLIQQAEAEQLVLAIKKPDSQLRSSESMTITQRALPELITKISPRIVGGSVAPRGKYPEFATIWIDGLDGYYYYACGGSLIVDSKVLTAAHCVVDFTTTRIYVLPNFYSFSDNFSFSDLIAVTADTAHPAYNAVTSDYDIAVLTLARSSNTATARILGGNDQLVGQLATAIGVGDTYFESGEGSPELREVNLPVVSNEVCNDAYGGGITPRMLCAGYSSGGKDSCQGDSGGPLWVNYEGQRTQVGVVSFGFECGAPGYYGVYARTTALISFIKQHAPSAIIQRSGPIVMAPINSLLLDD